MRCQDLHARLEPLLLYFVDAAARIDVDDPKWEMFLAVETKGEVLRLVRADPTRIGFSIRWPCHSSQEKRLTSFCGSSSIFARPADKIKNHSTDEQVASAAKAPWLQGILLFCNPSLKTNLMSAP